MGLDTEFWNISWIIGVPWLLFLTLIYYAKYKKRLGQLNKDESGKTM
ncbi:Uncharacterised protein [Mycobacterium tuberculosis]|nr:Uncharacterised protein [Mycobacterium tuberculosis]